jgi:hypothetical protein
MSEQEIRNVWEAQSWLCSSNTQTPNGTGRVWEKEEGRTMERAESRANYADSRGRHKGRGGGAGGGKGRRTERETHMDEKTDNGGEASACDTNIQTDRKKRETAKCERVDSKTK